MKRIRIGLLWVFVPLMFSGCMKNKDGSTGDNGAVRGKVTLDGTPLDKVTVAFFHPATKFGTVAVTDANGHYEIKCPTEIGLAPGLYEVSIRPETPLTSDAVLVDETMSATVPGFVPKNPPREKPKHANLPARYRHNATSGLRIEVVAGNSPNFDFDLTTKP